MRSCNAKKGKELLNCAQGVGESRCETTSASHGVARELPLPEPRVATLSHRLPMGGVPQANAAIFAVLGARVAHGNETRRPLAGPPAEFCRQPYEVAGIAGLLDLDVLVGSSSG